MIPDQSGILNWRRVSDRITTSGQPSAVEFAAIRALGVTHVINLGPHWNKGALDDEPGTLAALGLGYTYIPVDFENPTEADYAAFADTLAEHEEAVLHVHCIYNARVSAFFYRRAKELGDAEEAFARMDGIWRPGGVWADFIGEPRVSEENRYAGYEY